MGKESSGKGFKVYSNVRDEDRFDNTHACNRCGSDVFHSEVVAIPVRVNAKLHALGFIGFSPFYCKTCLSEAIKAIDRHILEKCKKQGNMNGVKG